MQHGKHTLVKVSKYCLLIALSQVMVVFPALGHGSFETPISRVYNCYLEGPETPDSAACQAIVADSGTQGLYDWNGVRVDQAAGNHEDVIASGELCSAGSEVHRGLDLARDDWVSTTIEPNANGELEFVYYTTAPHDTEYFEFYVTKPGYDPLQPLRWEDLEETPFCVVTNVVEINDRYDMTCPMPSSRVGKHVIYNIWQRDLNQSNEAFYACIDIEFGGDLLDDDNDSIIDTEDNCTQVANTGQIDADGDGIGNVCDADIDNNCIVNFVDIALFQTEFGGSNPIVDFNVDGFVNFLDFTILANSFLQIPGPSATGLCDD